MLQVLLEPCRYVTELLGGEACVSCSVVLPAFRHLDHVMDITDDDPAYVVKFKNAFQKDLAARSADANETWFKVATALHPPSFPIPQSLKPLGLRRLSPLTHRLWGPAFAVDHLWGSACTCLLRIPGSTAGLPRVPASTVFTTCLKDQRGFIFASAAGL
ncbi:hypothetical protein L3Q82_004468 [Scortum barcoo]|uniref:Uncharacterized protein n=1 Tax=Scortum barcoo TaxID=214431 RepID=A0ACB8VK00_9TELE|nr:hypothetical protein L3Q82_004468 [Scortum barcoo]